MLPFDMPGDFFNQEIPRGAIFSTKTGEFRVSNPAPAQPADDRFNSILSSGVAGGFQTFSAPRLFTPLDSNKMSANFRVPGSETIAAVTGFGAVFTDVDFPGETYMNFYDSKLCVIGKVFVPPLDKGLSFGGLIVIDPKHHGKNLAVVHQVDINLGTISVLDFAKAFPYASHDFNVKDDVVVADDFLYGEPQGVHNSPIHPIRLPKPPVKRSRFRVKHPKFVRHPPHFGYKTPFKGFGGGY